MTQPGAGPAARTDAEAHVAARAVAAPPGPAARGAVAPVWTVRPSPIGPLLLVATASGLLLLGFHATDTTVAERLCQLGERLDTPPTPREEAPRRPATHHLDTAAGELDAYFAGALRSFAVPLDWSLSGGYPRRVLEELLARVPYGHTIGYAELAAHTGEPDAARAVGGAMGANPLPVVVPCHRVVASDGQIGGFGGGLETKRQLLALEGVLPAPLF